MHIGQSHTGAKAHLTHIIGSRGPALLQRLVDIGNAGTLIRYSNHCRLGENLGGHVTTTGMDNHIHLGLIGTNGDAAHAIGWNA